MLKIGQRHTRYFTNDILPKRINTKYSQINAKYSNKINLRYSKYSNTPSQVGAWILQMLNLPSKC